MNNTARIIGTILLLALIASLSWNWIQNNRLDKAFLTNADLTYELNSYRDELGRSVAEKQSILADKKHLQSFYDTKLRTLADELKVNRKKIEGITQVSTQTVDTIWLPLKDTLKFSLESFSQTQWGSYKLQNDSLGLRLSYRIKDSLNFVEHYSRKWFLGPKTYYLKGISYNPATEIRGIDHIAISKTDKRFSLGLQAGYGITANGLKPYLGIGLNYSLIHF
ncbi:MAG: hypothetical protein CMI36_02690 [Owenweeksia sp.]|nr:hypothetical protein [Owenweeksia sp.]MBF97874.1 hypothetical protein [Owenweeksia sp.]HCQ17134.1 hypothetical protein [Cryomorphaceae bacterium]|tara:strand:- start:312 stop:977 length:666 start_codon:yes stop_codon:yes gene_type:complete